MGGWVHRLTVKDELTQTGTCINCGPVRIVKRSSGTWQCNVARDQQRNRAKYQKGRHGLTVEEAQELKQDSVCEVCGSNERLVIDHDHKIGWVRGILCHNCNVALGMAGDSPERLRALADYLEQ